MSDLALTIGLFFAKCGVLHVFLRIVLRKRYDKGIVISAIAVALAFFLYRMLSPLTLKLVPDGNGLSTFGLVVAGATLYLCAFPPVRYMLRPGRVLTPLACIVLAATSVGLDHATGRLAPEPEAPPAKPIRKMTPSVPKAIAPAKGPEVVGMVRDGAEAMARMTEKQEVESIGSDFRRGLELFKERKAWMDNLTPEEKAAYRAEMREFLAEQGLAQDRYSLEALRSVDPSNMQELASLFEGLEGMESMEPEQRSQSIMKSVSQIAANLSQLKVSEADRETLRRVAERVAVNDSQGAIDLASQQLHASGEGSPVAAAMLAALMQSEAGIPMDMILEGQEKEGDAFDLKSLLALMQKEEPKEIEEEPVVQTSLADASVEEAGVEVTEETHIPITTSLGVIHIPSDPETLGEWTAVTHTLSINGFVSLGNETVILMKDGTMYRNGDVWQLDSNGYHYRFSVDKVMKNKVHLSAIDRVEIVAEKEPAL